MVLQIRKSIKRVASHRTTDKAEQAEERTDDKAADSTTVKESAAATISDDVQKLVDGETTEGKKLVQDGLAKEQVADQAALDAIKRANEVAAQAEEAARAKLSG